MTNIQDILDKHTPWINQQERLYDEASVRSMLREAMESAIDECAEEIRDEDWRVTKNAVLAVKEQIA